MNFNINEGDRVKIETVLGNVFYGRIVEIDFEDEKEIGLWWLDKETNREEYLAFEEIASIKVIKETQLEKELRSVLGKKIFDELEGLADYRKTNVHNIVTAFVHDLVCSDNSGGSDERDLAYNWLSRNCIEGEFIR
jgi:uncharacterized protein with ACT and thioredoxin-like domain